MSRFKHIIAEQPDSGQPVSAPNYVYSSGIPSSCPTYQTPAQQQVDPAVQQAYSAWPKVFPKPIIGLEYDGVINVDKGPLTSPDQWEPIPGSIEAIKTMRLKGYKVVILSDQGGIKKGLQTHQQIDAIHAKAMDAFGKANIFSIDGFFYAESDIKEDMFAKPNIGMFERAEKEIYGGQYRFKHGGFYVGHRMKDLKAGIRAGATAVLVRTGQGKQTEEALQKFSAEKVRKKTRIYDNLLQFAQSLK